MKYLITLCLMTAMNLSYAQVDTIPLNTSVPYTYEWADSTDTDGVVYVYKLKIKNNEYFIAQSEKSELKLQAELAELQAYIEEKGITGNVDKVDKIQSKIDKFTEIKEKNKKEKKDKKNQG